MVSPVRSKSFLAPYVHKPCPFCGVLMGEIGSDFWSPTRDHLTPRSRGGSDCGSNIVICCKRCNEDKDNLTLLEWLNALLFVDDCRANHVLKFADQQSRRNGNGLSNDIRDKQAAQS